jgi:hypothetical protein
MHLPKPSSTVILALALLHSLTVPCSCAVLPPIDSFISSATLNKTVPGRSSAECLDTIHPDSLIGSNYEVALVLHDCTSDTRYSDGDFPVEYGTLSSKRIDGLEFTYYKVGEPATKATEFRQRHIKIYFKPISGISAYNVWRYRNGDFQNIGHVTQANVEAANAQDALNVEVEILPPTANVLTSVEEEKVIPGIVSQACKLVDGVNIHTDAIIDIADVLVNVALVKLPQYYKEGDVGKTCWGKPYQDASYPARKVTMMINAPHKITSIDAYEVDQPQQRANEFAASEHAIYFRPINGVQAYSVWAWDKKGGYFEPLADISEAEVNQSQGYNVGPWAYYDDINVEYIKEGEAKTVPGDDSMVCKNVDGIKTYDDAIISSDDTVGSIALVLLEYSDTCWSGDTYSDSDYPVSQGEMVVTNNSGEKLSYQAYKIGTPTKANSFRASQHGIYVKLDNSVSHTIWVYKDGEFKDLKVISQEDISSAIGKNIFFYKLHSKLTRTIN